MVFFLLCGLKLDWVSCDCICKILIKYFRVLECMDINIEILSFDGGDYNC